jgi:hypothetical protein|tara:strand:- start:1093 stop:1458 length:366 start_codon:yes stop_codon:yes gene_type:complete
MKMVTILAVDKPKSFTDLGFSEAEHKAAVRVGPKRVPYAVANEALKLSKGLYKIKAEKEPVEVEIKAAKQPEEMTKAELVAEMTAFGKPPRKQMQLSAVIEFVHKLRAEAAEMIMDDDDDE